MKTSHTLISNPLRSFLLKTLHEAPAKLPGVALALLVYYVLPLARRPDLLLSVFMIAPAGACFLVFMTQQAPNPDQLRSLEDAGTMRILAWATTLSQVSTMLQWGYFYRNHPYQWSLATSLGLFLILAGLWVRIWAIVELDRHFDNTIRILPGHQLIQTGPYRYIRHGCYTGAWLVGTGIGVFLSAWWGVVITVVVLGGAYIYRIRLEEKALVAHFGDEYRDYQRRTRMLIPFLL